MKPNNSISYISQVIAFTAQINQMVIWILHLTLRLAALHQISWWMVFSPFFIHMFKYQVGVGFVDLSHIG